MPAQAGHTNRVLAAKILIIDIVRSRQSAVTWLFVIDQADRARHLRFGSPTTVPARDECRRGEKNTTDKPPSGNAISRISPRRGNWSMNPRNETTEQKRSKIRQPATWRLDSAIPDASRCKIWIGLWMLRALNQALEVVDRTSWPTVVRRRCGLH